MEICHRCIDGSPEIGAESSQDIFVGFEADTFDNQHAVTEQTLNPLLLELLQEVGAVAGHGVHCHSAAEPPSSNFSIKNLAKGTHVKDNKSLFMEILVIPMVS